ncbi:hypothetical protein BGZ52_007148, partial [Haplosporangium bisporale]
DRRASITRTLFIRAIHFGSALAMVQWTQRIQLQEDIKAVQPKETDSMLVLCQPLNNAAFEREKKLAQIMPTVAPILLLSVATTINIYALFLEPDCMESSYYKFLINISRFPDAVGTNWRQWMELMRTRFGVLEQSPAEDWVSTREALAPHLARELVEAVVPAGMRHEYQLCAVLHPNMSCTGNTWAVATGAMTQAGKMYALLYGVMTFVWHHKKLEENPKEVVYRFVTSVVRSTAVSALATSVAANSVCLGRRMFGRERKLIRRVELTLYIALRCLTTSWKLLLKRGLVRRIPQWDTALFSLSMGVIMSVYQSRPEAVSKLYRGALDRVCGRGTIK